MKLMNDAAQIKLRLEPWGAELDLPPGETVILESNDPDEQPDVVIAKQEITLWWRCGVAVISAKTGELLLDYSDFQSESKNYV
jgi:hypothetical protein